MSNVRLITGIGQLVTMKQECHPNAVGELGVISDAAIAVLDGVVIELGSSSDLERQHKGAEILDVGGAVVTPGLVDAHTHMVYGGNRAKEFEMRISGRTYEEIARAGGGILNTVSATNSQSDQQLREAAERRIRVAQGNGVRLVETKSGYGLTPEAEWRILEIMGQIAENSEIRLCNTYLALHAVPNEYKDNLSGFVDIVLGNLEKVKARGIATSVDVFCEPEYFSLEHCEKVLGRAKELGFTLHVHADQLTCSGGAELAARLGALSADHLEQTGAEGIAALAGSSTVAVLLPTSVYCLGKEKYPDARAMLEAGVTVALASDHNPGSSPCNDMKFVMNLACLKMGMTPAEVLRASTVNAARALGLQDEYGTIEVGRPLVETVWEELESWQEIPYWIN